MKFLKKNIAFIFAAVLTAEAVMPVLAAENETADISASRVYGDINLDDFADIRDIVLLGRYLVNNVELIGETRCADLDFDGAVGIIDLTLLKLGVLKSNGANQVGRPVYDEEHIYTDEPLSGIDVSKWQGEIDWQGVKDSGIEFVMIKAGEGVKEEVKFRKNIQGAKSVGINCGVYWFANARNTEEALLEAKACLKTIADYDLEYPVAYDFEYRSIENSPAAENRELMTQIVRTFVLYIQSEGYYPIVYSNLDFLKHRFYGDLLGQFDLWYAHYNIEEADKPCYIWQRSCTGRVNGIDVDVDIDEGYKDYAAVIKKYQWNNWESYPTETSTELVETETTSGLQPVSLLVE